ncbi:DUF1822 family protein [Pleurocapsa sp. PCC 7319]|uniref:DUF1822 family protein n=1 Tax=Pleurocapsa sp. PCC 7319 TaxID=118161 RepID=UPI00034853DD|nr:DUF1822 family protein [Pleurocapsa sp. PCC 7319]
MTTVNQSLFNPTQLVLELNETIINQAWSQSSNVVNDHSRWQNYLNQVTLNAFLPWLQTEEDSSAQASFDLATNNDIWEVVNGTAISLKDAKLVLIPSEAEDLSELRVPQEWIDIPEWSADYYLAVQVNVDAGYIRVWGYATHQQLKTSANFSHNDRTYTLTDDELISDIDVLWVARELCPEEVTQVEVEPVTAIAPTQAENLIKRLGDRSILLPRLAVPFRTWAALVQNKNWCRRLAATRRGVTYKTPVLQWLQQGMTNLTTDLGWRPIEMTPSAIGARGVATPEPTTSSAVPSFGLAKQVAIANQSYELKILPLPDLSSWRFELRSLTPGGMIPAGFKLRLLTEDLQAFEGNEDLATEPVEQLCLEVDLDAGESLVWQIEPTPDNYQPEVLQF